MPLTDEQVRQRVASVAAWYHQILLRPGIITPGINAPQETLRHLELPADCRGMRVLDLGTRDGFFAFEMERRGAAVVAIDYAPKEATGFQIVAEVLGSNVTYFQENLYSLSTAKIGVFDIVLFLGLLYHLPDPVQAIHIVRSLCKGRLCLETHSIDNGLLLPDGTKKPLAEIHPILAQTPLMQFYPGRTLAGDPTNYWGPNLKCLEGMLAECRFMVRSRTLTADRAIVNCDVVEDPRAEYLLNLARGLRPGG